MPGIRQGLDKRLFGWISDVGERVGTDRVSQLFDDALSGAARTRAAVDKNLESVLKLANIPSRSDYLRMQRKLDSLQGSVMNLSRTLEKLRSQVRANTRNGSTRAAKPSARRPKQTRRAAAKKRARKR